MGRKMKRLFFQRLRDRYGAEAEEMPPASLRVRRRGVLAVILWGVVLIAGFSGPPRALAQEEPDRLSLRGLKSVYVIVEDLPAELQEKGPFKALIQATMEEKVKRAGLVLLSREAWQNTPGTPLLYANVNLSKAKTKDGVRACSINLCLAQRTNLERDPTLRSLGRTWQAGIVGLVGDADMEVVVSQVGTLVDYFLSEVRAAS
jgi:hypothetical protein